jgi:MFS family permease
MQRIEKQVIAYISVCHALVHIFELIYGVVLIGIGHEFGVGLFALGLLANLAGFAFGLAALPAGFLADRIGERRLLILFCFASAIASVIVGVSPNIYVLGSALAMLGLAIGIFHPVASAFLTKAIRQRGIAFGYFGVGGNLGVALGPLLAGAIASPLGWRAPYLVFAIPALATAFLLYFFKTEVPAAPQPEPLTANASTNLRSIILPLALIFLASAMNGLIYRGLVTFLPLYLSEGIHFKFLNWSSIALAGSFTSVALIFGVVGQLRGGYLCERIRREALALVIAIVAIPLMLLMANTQGLSLMLTAIVLAFFHFMGQPIYNNLVADYSPVAWRGRSYGISFFCSFGIGSFSATFLGYIAERSNTSWIFGHHGWHLAGSPYMRCGSSG